ncbi:integrating conjugative element protein [Delftia sp. PS-11]|uniref:integrating conjugative element protein n=1 Tax=Delftia sp. PS-11 TaxID=2767222 RepID=UPI002456A0D4|nr:integrating conjugative element protein [Delftia sp. PS-11]KAJ8744140.1 integrating conjugative element protein [Delftia sp. PS-11]
MTFTPRKQIKKVLQSVTTVALACALTAISVPAAQAQPVSSSSLYYRMGGGSPTGTAPNRGSLSAQLSAGVRANYSCGKFDIGISWSTLMNSIQNLGATISGAIQAGIAALPLYFLQRAQPGLYQLFQNFSQKADLMVAASLKSCEEMEAMIKSGKDPYEDYIALAKGDAWKIKASAAGDVVQAKVDINKNEEAQRNGLDWVFGAKAGGAGTAPIQPVRDLAVAGYNVTINKSANSLSTANYGSSSLASTRLVQAFSTPEDLARWSTEVLGDKKIYLCTQDSSCPNPTSTATATGLAPKYEQELDSVLPAMRNLASGKTMNMTELAKVSAPGMAVSPQLMDAMRKLPADVQSVAVNRLSQEIAMHKVIDKALIARNALISGLSLPQATAAGQVNTEVQTKIDRLTQYINDMMFEFRIRKEMTGDTALAIMNNDLSAGRLSNAASGGLRADPAPLVDGRVGVQK